MLYNIHEWITEWNCQSAETLLFQFHGVIIIQLIEIPVAIKALKTRSCNAITDISKRLQL